MIKVGVIGAGSWGTALAIQLDSVGQDVTVWSIIEEEIKFLNEKREHIEKLPGVKISEKIKFTTDLEETCRDKDMIVLAVPSVFTRKTAASMKEFVRYGQLIVSVAKGIEESTLMTLEEVIKEELPQAEVAVLCGPSHAEEVGRALPTAVVAGSRKKSVAEFVQSAFMGDKFRVYTSPDVLGMEIGSSLKNVIALAAGMADGLGCGDNTKAALITRGIAEITRLAVAMGACPETLQGLTGIGDLIVTCASVHSRNRKAGYLMGQGKTMKEATEEVQMVVEGVYSAKAALLLAKKYDVDMPIVEAVNKVLFEDHPVKEAVNELMIRDGRIEHNHLKFPME